MTPKDFGKELAATKMQNIYMRRQAWKKIKDKRIKVEIELANLRSGVLPPMENIEIPEDIKAMSAEEVMAEIRQRGGNVSAGDV
jgi:hypothetical protein